MIDHMDFLEQMEVFDIPSEKKQYEDWLDTIYSKQMEFDREMQDIKRNWTIRGTK